MVVASLLLLGQVPLAEGLSLEPPKGWQRFEDEQRRYYALLPPGLAAQSCALLVLVPLEFAGTEKEWHDVAVLNASQGSQILGEVKTGSAGHFKVSSFSQKSPAGATQWVSVYTIRWGKHGQSVVYASGDEKLFKQFAPDVLALLEKTAPPGGAPPPATAPPAPSTPSAAAAAGSEGVSVAGLQVPLPAGWARNQDASGWTVITPAPSPFSDGAQVWIAPSQKVQGGHWVAHRALLKSMIESLKWPGSNVSHNPAGPGPFIQSDASSSITLAGAFKLYTAMTGDRMEAVVVSPLGLRGVSDDIYAVLQRTTLKDASGGPRPPAVVEAYRRPSMKTYLNIDGSTFHGQVKYERILLLSNGAADLTSHYSEGYGASSAAAKVDPDLLNGFYGRWKAEGNKVRILRQEGQPEQVYERENGNLRLGDQVWTPMPRVDGLKLKGRYAYKSKPGGPLEYNYWLEFTEEGGFRTGGVLTWLAVTDLLRRPKPPETASGTYEIRDWTIWFKVDGKTVWSTDFMTLKDDPRDLATVLIETFGFTRE